MPQTTFAFRVHRALAPPGVFEEKLNIEAQSAANALGETVQNQVPLPSVPGASAELDAFIQYANGHRAQPNSGALARNDLSVLRDHLAETAWAQPDAWSGEVAIASLHVALCEWGPDPESSPTPVTHIEVAIEALDFMRMVLGPHDHLHWSQHP
jgi:hypothetical protein